MESVGFEVEGLFSRAECMGKLMEAGGTKGSDIKAKRGKKRWTSLWILGGNSVKTMKAKGEEGESLKKRERVGEEF